MLPGATPHQSLSDQCGWNLGVIYNHKQTNSRKKKKKSSNIIVRGIPAMGQHLSTVPPPCISPLYDPSAAQRALTHTHTLLRHWTAHWLHHSWPPATSHALILHGSKHVPCCHSLLAAFVIRPTDSGSIKHALFPSQVKSLVGHQNPFHELSNPVP